MGNPAIDYLLELSNVLDRVDDMNWQVFVTASDISFACVHKSGCILATLTKSGDLIKLFLRRQTVTFICCPNYDCECGHCHNSESYKILCALYERLVRSRQSEIEAERNNLKKNNTVEIYIDKYEAARICAEQIISLGMSRKDIGQN